MERAIKDVKVGQSPDPGGLNAYWYIACEARDLRRKPITRQVLGQPLVLFRAQTGEPVALLDRCPHRNLALSEGWLRQGELVCRYHGWQFGPQGDCRLIPGRCQQRALPQYNAIAHPALEQDGFVWVYGQAGPVPESKPYRIPLLGQPGVGSFRWQMTERVSLENAAENLLDGLHTHFVHSGLIRQEGQRQHLRVKVSRDQHQVEARYQNEAAISGLIYQILGRGQQHLQTLGRFLLPGIAQVDYQVNGDNRLLVTLLITPVDHQSIKTYGVVTFRWGLPRWLGVAIAKPLFWLATQQDRHILRQQAANLERFGGEQFISTELDVMRPHIMALMAAARQQREVAPLEKTVEMWV